jgi:hypothetical protein
VSEPPYHHRPPAQAQPGRPQGLHGTSRLPMQALGAPPADLPPAAPQSYTSYAPAPSQPEGRSGGPTGRSMVMDYTLKGLGLLGVAVVSGFLWWLFRHNSAPAAQATGTTGQNTGVYQFVAFHDPTMDSACADHATNQVQAFFRQHECAQLTRALYTTKLSDGSEVVTSVAVVKMNSAELAQQLKQYSDGTNTGHVKDLVEEGVTSIPGGPKNLENGGYGSAISGNSVTIAITEYKDRNQDSTANLNANNATLTAVSKDALRLGNSN